MSSLKSRISGRLGSLARIREMVSGELRSVVAAEAMVVVLVVLVLVLLLVVTDAFRIEAVERPTAGAAAGRALIA